MIQLGPEDLDFQAREREQSKFAVTEKFRLKIRCLTGFTLVEIAVGIAVLGIFTAALLYLLAVADIAWQQDMGLVDLQQQARQAMEGLSREIRQSRPSAVIVSAEGTRISFSLAASHQPIAYFLSNGQLSREHPAGTLTVLMPDVSALNFCCIGGSGCADCANAHLVRVNLQATKGVKGRTLSFGLSEQIKLRNE